VGTTSKKNKTPKMSTLTQMGKTQFRFDLTPSVKKTMKDDSESQSDVSLFDQEREQFYHQCFVEDCLYAKYWGVTLELLMTAIEDRYKLKSHPVIKKGQRKI